MPRVTGSSASISLIRRMQGYIAANAGPFRKYGARFLVRAGRFEDRREPVVRVMR